MLIANTALLVSNCWIPLLITGRPQTNLQNRRGLMTSILGAHVLCTANLQQANLSA